MNQLVVASKNPVKINAALNSFKKDLVKINQFFVV